VRHFGTKARIEVPKECIQRLEEARKEIEKAIRVLEFQEVEFDEEGFVSGKLNRALARRQD
jgi:pyridinium-3,5-biscarboxylic acid mononucleotide sulfurtransferase